MLRRRPSPTFPRLLALARKQRVLKGEGPASRTFPGLRARAMACPLWPQNGHVQRPDHCRLSAKSRPLAVTGERPEILVPCGARIAMPTTRKRRSSAVRVGLRCHLHAGVADNPIAPAPAFATSAVRRLQRPDLSHDRQILP